jgi:hypothetical protein
MNTHACSGAVQAGYDDPVAFAVEQREALVAAGVLEGVETNHADVLDRAPTLLLDHRQPAIDRVGAFGQLIEPPQGALHGRTEVGCVDNSSPTPSPHAQRQQQHPGQREQCHKEGGDGDSGAYVGGHGAAF